MIEYLPIALTFLAAILGIVGKSFDDKKKGLNRITPLGKFLMLVALLASICAGYILYESQQKIKSESEFAKIKINRAIHYLVKHLSDTAGSEKIKFKNLEDTIYLRKKIAPITLYQTLGVFNFNDEITGPHDQEYKLYADNIKYGKDQLNEVTEQLHEFIDKQTLDLIAGIINDGYFIKNYSLQNAKFLIDGSFATDSLAKIKDPKSTRKFIWGCLGSPYFELSCDDNRTKEKGNYRNFIELMKKIEKLSDYINK